MKLLINLIRPKFLIPVHGELRHLRLHGKIGEELGIPEENIAVVENGTPLELTRDTLTIEPRMPGGYIFVDGSSVGDIGWSVVRDRDKLAQAGFFFAVVSTNNKGQMIGTPDLRTRGFVDRQGAEELYIGAEETLARAIHNNQGEKRKMVKRTEEALSRYLYEETRRRPIVQVVIR